MKLTLPICLMAALAPLISGGQSLTITPGTHVVASGQPNIVLSDLSLVNNGAFVPDSSTVIFTGGNLTLPVIDGSGNLDFYRLIVNKSFGNVQMQRNITAADRVQIVQGNLQLFATSLDLGATGQLSGERDGNYVLGLDQGLVRATANIDRNIAGNPGNLGLQIYPTKASMGMTTIERTNTMASLGNGLNSIRRIYHVSAENNGGLGAYVLFPYFPSELADPNIGPTLYLYTAGQFGGPWTRAGRDTIDVADQLLIRSGLDSLQELTLGDTLENVIRTGNAVANVFPDPTMGAFTLTLVSGITKTYNVEILSQSGLIVKTLPVLVKAGQRRSIPIDISNRSAGYYYLLIDGPGSQAILFQKM